MSHKLSLRAFAKVNLALEVIGRRGDGYHELVTVLQTVSFHDDLHIRPALEDAIAVSAPAGWNVPADASNLVLRAVAAYRPAESGGAPKLAVNLLKRIPPAGGLGGGSSDAAALLRALDHVSPKPRGFAHLVEVAAQVGSDVPFFVRGGLQLAEGRGERLTALPDAPEAWLVLAIPPLALDHKTARLFGLLGAADFSDGHRSRATARAVDGGAALEPSMLVNTFERVADAAFPELGCYRGRVRDVCGHAALSGAGPALFAIMRGRAAAERARCRALADTGAISLCGSNRRCRRVNDDLR